MLPDISEVPDPGNMLLKEEFDEMPETGLVDPNRIRTTQIFADEAFKPESGTSERKLVVDLIADLKSGRVRPEDVEPIDLVVVGGKVWTLGHRRLVAAREAGKLVRYRKRLSNRGLKDYRRKMRSKTDGLSIDIRKGVVR